jgi:galactoside O-acetyltransferase
LTNRFDQELSDWVMAFCRIAPGAIGRRLRTKVFFKKLKYAGSNIYFGQNVWIEGWQNISIGDRVSIDRGCILTSTSGSLEIGNNSALNTNIILGADGGSIKIGNDVIIGMNTVIRAANHNFDQSPKILIRKQGHSGGNITIDDDVWIGANVTILTNVMIGSHCVIGAGSVVTKDIPSGSIVAGVPAKVIKYI